MYIWDDELLNKMFGEISTALFSREVQDQEEEMANQAHQVILDHLDLPDHQAQVSLDLEEWVVS